MENNEINIKLKEYGFNTPQELAEKPISRINKFMKETGLSYFEVFLQSQIPDILEYIDKDEIRIIRVKNGTKRPLDNDFYNKRLTTKEILEHKGNFGVCVGYNHLRGKSLACVDIDGFKIPKLTKVQKSLLPHDQSDLLENLSLERKEEIIQESKDYLLTCLLGALPNAIAVKTQSGGYHLFIWNETHLNQGLEDIFHYTSKHLKFPKNCPIKEIRGLSLLNSLEIFTTFESKQCVLAGSFTKNYKTGETNHYKLLDIVENTCTLGEMGTVSDINKSVKNHLIEMGFIWNDKLNQDQEDKPIPKGQGRPRTKKETILNPTGILKQLNDNEVKEIVQILTPLFKGKQLQGVGHYTVLALGGYFCNTITEESSIKIIQKLLKNAGFKQDTIKAGIKAIKENYKRENIKKTGLKTAFDNIQNQLGLTNDERVALQKQLQSICYPTMDKTNKTEQDLEILIKQSLCKNKDPNKKVLADYINKQDFFFVDYETGKKYKQTDKGFEEIQVQDISIFLNKVFGENKISIKQCEAVMSYITNPINSNYDLIVFNNGTLNTKTTEFKENYFPNDCLPKIKTHLNYIENAESKYKETKLYKEFKEILKSERWGWNEELYYKCVGVSAMAINEADSFFVIVGVPNARKTTLLTPLKRFFTYSELKIQTIAHNDRFQLLPSIRKDINLDDDLSDTIIKNSGFLKTFISGAGGTVERKGENIPAELTAETTPKIWGASNKLPTIHGEGIERRTCLILAENPINTNEAKKSYQRQIIDGTRDQEVELLFSYSLQYYMKQRDKPFLTDDQQTKMLNEWDWKSYPAKMGANLVFMDTDKYLDYLTELEAKGEIQNITYDERNNIITYEPKADTKLGYLEVEVETWTPVYKVNKEFKKFYKIAIQKDKIFKELSRPSTKLINQAMSNAGFFQTKKNVSDNYGNREQVRVYEDCIINPIWEKELI